MSAAADTPGAWAPLREAPFRALWLAILVSNIGTWVNDVAAAWVMAERTASPLLVAAVQSATTLPVVLFALVAGTLADIVDRRRYLLFTQFWMFGVACALATLMQAGRLDAWGLLLLTFAMGTGAAMAMPAQAAIVSELVPRPLLPSAIALNSVGMNIARFIGPALGGLVVARFGATWAFALNAASFLAMLVVLWRWRRAPAANTLPPETFADGVRAGLRYVARAPRFQAVLVKSAAFFAFASALPALLPVVVRSELQRGAGSYGVLLGCMGAGAVLGALLLPRLRARIDRDRLVLAASLGCALTLAGLALLRAPWALAGVMFVNGFAWITVLSSLQIAAQTTVPGWVRARALAIYIMVFSLGMAGGGLLWGSLATLLSIPASLLIAAGACVLASLLVLRARIGGAEALDLAPSQHWPAPAGEAAHDRGPVLVTIEYLVDPARRAEFHDAIVPLGATRRRDGALSWGVGEDAERSGVFVEHFVVASWLAHLRQHERVTGDDRVVQARVLALHRGDAPPRVRHIVGGIDAAPLPPHAHHHG